MTKRSGTYTAALLAMVVAAALLLTAAPAHAASTVTIGEVTVPAGDTHVGDLTVTIGEATVSGHVTGSVRSSLGSITIRGTVGGDVVSTAGEIRIEAGGQVAGNVITTAGEVVIRGTVGGDVEQDAGEVRIAGEVAGDVRVRHGYVRLLDGAVVGGGVYVEEGWVERSSGATAGTVQVVRERREFGPSFGWDWSDGRLADSVWTFGMLNRMYTGWQFGRALVLLLAGLVALALFPQRLQRMSAEVSERPGRSLGFGVLALVAQPLVIVLLFISILGIVLVPFAIVGFLLLWLLGQIVAAFALGRALSAQAFGQDPQSWHEFARLAIGLLVLIVLSYVPLVGWLATAAAVLIGVGAVFTSRFGRRPTEAAPPPQV